MVLEENVKPESVLKRLVANPQITVKRFEQVEVSLDEIFVRVVSSGNSGTGQE
jgi:ABC-type uncharacterized transport system ATPase subunit